MKRLTRHMNKWQLFFICALAPLAAPSIALADVEPTFSELKELAKKAARANKPAEAARLWIQAWNLKPDWDLPCNIGRAFFVLQKPADVATWLSRCVRVTPFPTDERKEAQRREERAMLEIALDHVGVLFISAPSGARVSVDGQFKAMAPLDEDIFVLPGPHEISIELNGRSASHSIQAKRRQKTAFNFPIPNSAPKPVLFKLPSPMTSNATNTNAMAVNSSGAKRWMPSLFGMATAALLSGASLVLAEKSKSFGIKAGEIAEGRDERVNAASPEQCKQHNQQYEEQLALHVRMHNASAFTATTAGVLLAGSIVYPILHRVWPFKSNALSIEPAGLGIGGRF